MPVTIAITGHRPNRLSGPHTALELICREVLSVIRKDIPKDDPQPIVLSGLAEGADRIFAEAALKEDFRLEAVFPFQEDDYRTTFMSPHSDDFYMLKEKASNIHLLNGDIQDMETAFHDLGRFLVEKCDMLVAIWDGEAGIGKGGTPDVIDLARAANKPVVWINADGSTKLHIMTSDHVADIELDEIARFV